MFIENAISLSWFRSKTIFPSYNLRRKKSFLKLFSRYSRFFTQFSSQITTKLTIQLFHYTTVNNNINSSIDHSVVIFSVPYFGESSYKFSKQIIGLFKTK